MTTKTRFRIRRVQVSDEIKRLETRVARFELRYECSSDVALREVKAGRLKETADVASWLISYRDLRRMQEIQAGAETGSPTKTT